jgi:glycosyltransferase involved in cell wall biosynthesis
MADGEGVSIVTPVNRPVPRYLAELHASLDGQDEVEWEWVVQLDGDAALIDLVPAGILGDPRVRLEANGRWLGQAVTRNLALVRTSHRLLQTVDADDTLEPGALAAGVEAMAARPDVALVFGRTRNLMPDGALVEGKNPYPPGPIAPGRLGADWERRDGSCPIVVPSVMWRTAAVEAEGGWAASAAGEDVLLLLAVNSWHPALCLDRYTYRYRQHPEQTHRGALREEMRPRYRDLARRMLGARRGVRPDGVRLIESAGANRSPRVAARSSAPAGPGSRAPASPPSAAAASSSHSSGADTVGRGSRARRE